MNIPADYEHKGKLNLTVSKEKRKLAAKLADIQNRSISNLFEVLVEREWRRTHVAHN